MAPAVIPGWCASTRPQMRNRASGNLEIPGSMREPVIGPRIARTRWHRPGMTKNDETRIARILFRLLRPVRLAVAHQAIEMHADVRGLRRGIGKRDGAVEGDACFLVAAELHQERAAHAEEMKIIGKPRLERRD